ncbi:winged helix-turn-helix domain-containing protein [Cuniculiplasma sp. SKW4]|uniref:winged helix-turn-helix domain-containing protein n=1 Tax=Cuniculiplasma sp. SKW4 TaxID=3400171 RepID=UPI003FD5B8E6
MTSQEAARLKGKLTKVQNEKLKRIFEVIEKEFDVEYIPTHIWRVLKNLGYSGQIPVAVTMEKNTKYLKEWLEKNYPEYVKEANEKNATFLFHDESGVQSRPNLWKTWPRKVGGWESRRRTTGIVYQ